MKPSATLMTLANMMSTWEGYWFANLVIYVFPRTQEVVKKKASSLLCCVLSDCLHFQEQRLTLHCFDSILSVLVAKKWKDVSIIPPSLLHGLFSQDLNYILSLNGCKAAYCFDVPLLPMQWQPTRLFVSKWDPDVLACVGTDEWYVWGFFNCSKAGHEMSFNTKWWTMQTSPSGRWKWNA